MDNTQHLCQQVEQAVSSLYATSNENERREANLWLQHFTTTPDAWDVCPRLLMSPSASKSVQFFAANALYSKIRKEWDNFKPDERKGQLRSVLISIIRTHVEDPTKYNTHQPVLDRVALALAAMSMQSLQAVDAHVEEAKVLLVGGMEVGVEDPSQRAVATRAFSMCTELLHGLPEEKEIAQLSFQRAEDAHLALRNVLPKVLALIEHLVLVTHSVPVEQRARAIDCIHSWSKVGINITLLASSHPRLFSALLENLNGDDSELLVASSHALLAVLDVKQYPPPSGNEAAFDAIIGSLLSKRSRLQQTMAEEDEECGNAIVKVASAVGELAVEKLAEGNGNSLQFVEYLMECTSHPIRLVARHSLDFWLCLQDVPTAERHATLREPCYAKLLEILVRQCRVPSNAMTLGSLDYDLESFRDASDGVKDSFVTTWYLLETDYLKALFTWLGQTQQWQDAEALLFALDAVAEQVKEFVRSGKRSGPQHPHVCNQLYSFFKGIGSSQLPKSHPLLLAITTKLLGKYALVFDMIHLSADQSSLVVAGDVLVVEAARVIALALENPSTLNDAAYSLNRVCLNATKAMASQPIVVKELVCKLEASLHVSGEVPNSRSGEAYELSQEKRIQAVQGLVRVINVVKDAGTASELLEALVSPCLGRIVQLLEGTVHVDDAIQKCTDDLQVLETTFRYVDCNWGGVDPKKELFSTVWPVLDRILQVLNSANYPVLAKGVYSFLGRLFLVAKDSAFGMLGTILQAATTQFEKYQYVQAISCMASAVEVFGRDASDGIQLEFLNLLDKVSEDMFACVKSGETAKHPELIREFFKFIFRFFLYCPKSLFEARNFSSIVELAAVSAGNQEKESTREVLQVLREIITRSHAMAGNWTIYKPQVSAALASHGKTLTRQLIVGVMGASPEILAANVAATLFALFDSVPTLAQQWTVEVLQEEQSGVLTPEDKENFINLAVHLAGTSQKFKQMVKDVFDICRGTQTRDVLLSYTLT